MTLAQQQLLRPMVATPAAEPFDSADHIFEIKWGGVRALAFIEDGNVTLIGSGGRDISEWYPELVSLPGQLKGRVAVLDGEIVAVGKEGYPNLELLRERFKAFGMAPPPRAPEENAAEAVTYQVYDILLAGERVLLDQPLWQRKKILHSVLTPSTVAAATDFIDGEGVAFYQAALEHRLEGVVAKHKQSEYRPGERSSEWLDLSVLRSGDFIIGGYSFGGRQKPTARRRPKLEPFSELLVGAYDGAGDLVHVGSVSGPFTLAEAGQILGFMSEQHSAERPFSHEPQLREQRFIQWCRPELVCRLRFSSWTSEGKLRFPYFVALRPDLLPTDCVLEI